MSVSSGSNQPSLELLDTRFAEAAAMNSEAKRLVQDEPLRGSLIAIATMIATVAVASLTVITLLLSEDGSSELTTGSLGYVGFDVVSLIGVWGWAAYQTVRRSEYMRRATDTLREIDEHLKFFVTSGVRPNVDLMTDLGASVAKLKIVTGTYQHG